MHLTIHERSHGEVTILELEGRLTLGPEADALHNHIKTLLKAGKNRIILELHKIIRVDSVGLGTMIGAVKSARSAGGDVRLLRLSKAASDVLDLLGLKVRPDILRIFEDEQEAVDSFRSP